MHITRWNRPSSRGIPNFGGISPSNDIIISQKCHVLAPKNPKTRCARDFTDMGLCNVTHFKISNAIFEKMEPSFNLKSWLSMDFSVIWRWYKRRVCIFTQFPVKNGWNFEIRSRECQPSWNIKYVAHFEFSNLILEVMELNFPPNIWVMNRLGW